MVGQNLHFIKNSGQSPKSDYLSVVRYMTVSCIAFLWLFKVSKDFRIWLQILHMTIGSSFWFSSATILILLTATFLCLLLGGMLIGNSATNKMKDIPLVGVIHDHDCSCLVRNWQAYWLGGGETHRAQWKLWSFWQHVFWNQSFTWPYTFLNLNSSKAADELLVWLAWLAGWIYCTFVSNYQVGWMEYIILCRYIQIHQVWW